MRTKSPVAFMLIAAVSGLLLAGLLTGCSTGAKEKPFLETVFDEGRVIFYKGVIEGVDKHPGRVQLTAGESAKVKNLQNVYPRLYAILMNYYYRKDEPVFTALKKEGGPESMQRFRAMYLDLAAFSAGTFVRSLLTPSSHGLNFKDLIPRFKGLDAVDIVVLSSGYKARLDVPPPAEKPAVLSPEFEKQWGLDAAGFRSAHRITRGKGVRVAVLDSGIDPTHPVFTSTPWGPHFNFVGRDGFPWTPEGRPMVDYGWHGTVVSSIVASYAPEAQITVYRYNDADTMNDSPYPTIAVNLMGAAVYKAVHDGNDVINISAGSILDSEFLKQACQYAYDNNVVLVTGSQYSLGRYLGQNEDYPGQYPVNVAVTGIAKLADNRFGYWDAASPDTTTAVGAPCDPFVAYPYYSGEKDEYAAGISCATPIVASLAALIESVYPRLGTEPPGAYAAAVKKILADTANSRLVGFEGFSPDCGYGMIDAEKAVKAALELQAGRQVPPPPIRETSPAPSSPEDGAYLQGGEIFYKQLSVTLGLHPDKYRLRLPEIERLERGAEGIPGLYENVINVLFWKEGPRLLDLRGKNDDAAFREKYFGLCREAADRFVESLFTESPDAQERLRASGNLGYGRLDLVLDSLGRSSDPGRTKDILPKATAGLDTGRAFEISRFSEALKSTKGAGLKLAIIDSGCAFEDESLTKANFNRGLDFSMTDRRQPPWERETKAFTGDHGRGTFLAAIVAACAPETEIRTYKIVADPGSPFEYWPAMELAQSIYKATEEGCDIILTGAAFSRDFPFLREACQWAYYRNVIIVAPNGVSRPGGSDAAPAYPSTYNMVLAVAGVTLDKGGRPAPWLSSAGVKETIVSAPAFFVPNMLPSNAYAAGAVGGLAALVSTKVPKTGKEYPGQQVQRVVEILKKSADPGILGFRTFHPRVGYGLINAENAVGSAAQAFIQKMNQTDEHFIKRMAERAKEQEEADRKEAEAKKKK
jgi:subtilisin family serine protease